MKTKILVVAFAALILSASLAAAQGGNPPPGINNDYRSAIYSWRRVSDNPDGSVTVAIRALEGWNDTGDLRAVGVQFGDGSDYLPEPAEINELYSAMDPVGGLYYNVLREYTALHVYSAADIVSNSGRFTVVAAECCRSGILINAEGGDIRSELVIDLNNGNQGSPVALAPMVINFPVGQVGTFAIPVLDPDGDPVNCRLATVEESLIFYNSEINGQALTVSPDCVLSWNLSAATAADEGRRMAVGVVVEENNRCTGTGDDRKCGSTALDFMVEPAPATMPTCSVDKPLNNYVGVGQTFTATVVGASTIATDLNLNALGLPETATLQPPTASSGPAPYASDFAWTPLSADDESVQALLFSFSAEDGLVASCGLILEVNSIDCLGVPNGSAVLDRCGVCNGNGLSCLGCESVDISADQVTLAKIVPAQGRLIKTGARALAKAGVSRAAFTKLQKKEKNLRKRNLAIAQGIPAESLQCTNTVLCIEVSSEEILNEYQRNAKRLLNTGLKIARIMKANGLQKAAKRLTRKARLLFKQSAATLSSIPTSTSQCS